MEAHNFVTFRKERDLGAIITDTFKFIRLEWKPFFSYILKIAIVPILLAVASVLYISYASSKAFSGIDFENLATVKDGSFYGDSVEIIVAVFLMLIFFLVAGTVAPPLDPGLSLVETSELEGREPPNALLLHANGTLSFRGFPIEPQKYMKDQGIGPIRIVPDRNVSGSRLIEVTGELRRFGASSVLLVTERVLE